MTQSPSDIHLLMDMVSTNGTAVAIVCCPAGDDPFYHLLEWYRRQGFTNWDTWPRDKYEYVGRYEDGGRGTWVIVTEWYDGVINTGNPKRRTTKYDLGGEW